MAGRPKTRAAERQDDPARETARRRNQRTVKTRARRRHLYGEAMKTCAEAGAVVRLTGGVTTLDVLNEVLERTVLSLRYAAAQVDALHPDDFWVRRVDAQENIVVEPNRWIQLEAALREEAGTLAANMEKLGIAERHVALAEAQGALIQRAIGLLLDRLELTPAQRRLVGPAMREARALLTPGAEAVAA